MQSIQPAFTTFQDIDGQPLENGYIYIGTAGLAAATNQIQVYWDSALSVPATQPIRTIGGYPMNSGSPGVIYTGASDFSIAVNNKNNSPIISATNKTQFLDSSFTNFTLTGGTERTLQSKLSDFVSVKDFGAVGDGVTDDSAAIQSAIVAADHVIFPLGTYLVNSSITISTGGKTLFGAGGVLLRGSGMGANSVIVANGLDGMSYTGLIMEVEDGTPHSLAGGFIEATNNTQLRCTSCRFDAEIKNVGTQKESLFSGLAIGGAFDAIISNCQFRYIYGQGTGADDTVGAGNIGQNVVIDGCLFYNCVDTSVGVWTNGGKASVSNNIFHRDDYTTSYDGVFIDVAGGKNTSINDNVFTGNTIGLRCVSNVGYTNSKIVVSNNVFADQAAGLTEDATGIKVSHQTSSGSSKDMDILILGNTFEIVDQGLNIISDVTDTSKFLSIQVTDNIFDLNAAGSIGAFFQKSGSDGAVRFIPGTNTFIGSTGTPVSGNIPNGVVEIAEGVNLASHKSIFQFTGTSATDLDFFSCSPGLYSLEAAMGTCTDGASGGTLQLQTLAGGAYTPLSKSGSNPVIEAASSDTVIDAYMYGIINGGVHKFRFLPNGAGHTHNYHYLRLIRII